MGYAAHESQPGYRPRAPQQTVLYQVVAAHLETFLAECHRGEHALPAHVEGELRRFLDCGIYCRGFSRWRCEVCGAEKVVACSCKGRGFCPSCIGRRMNETAALLVDHVLPPVPVRHYVLTLPLELRYRLAYDSGLCSEALRIFLRAVFGLYRRQAVAMGYAGGRTGAFTVIQRCNSDLRTAPHFHSLLLDGVYVEGDAGPVFIETPAPTEEEIRALVETVAQRVIQLLVQRGVLDETASTPDPLSEQEPVLAVVLQASVQGTSAVGERAGKRIRRVLQDPARGQRTGDLCYASRGFSLHAARRVHADQGNKREELLRYVLRPPLANSRLKWLSDQELLLRLKTPWQDGSTHLLLSPMELLGRLAAMVPPKGFNSVRYHGCLAPRSQLRAAVIPVPAAVAVDPSRPPESESCPAARPRRIPWADLLRRVFRADVERCACGGRLRLVAYVTDPVEAARYLKHVGLPASAPAIAPARAPPRAEFDLEAC
jgi:hypothetical protein